MRADRIWPLVTGLAGVGLLVSLFLRWSWEASGLSHNAWDAHIVMAIALTAAGALGISIALGASRGSKHVIVGLQAGAALVLSLIGAALAVYHAFDDPFPRGSGPGALIGFAAAILVADGSLRVVAGIGRRSTRRAERS